MTLVFPLPGVEHIPIVDAAMPKQMGLLERNTVSAQRTQRHLAAWQHALERVEKEETRNDGWFLFTEPGIVLHSGTEAVVKLVTSELKQLEPINVILFAGESRTPNLPNATLARTELTQFRASAANWLQPVVHMPGMACYAVRRCAATLGAMLLAKSTDIGSVYAVRRPDGGDQREDEDYCDFYWEGFHRRHGIVRAKQGALNECPPRLVASFPKVATDWKAELACRKQLGYWRGVKSLLDEMPNVIHLSRDDQDFWRWDEQLVASWHQEPCSERLSMAEAAVSELIQRNHECTRGRFLLQKAQHRLLGNVSHFPRMKRRLEALYQFLQLGVF